MVTGNVVGDTSTAAAPARSAALAVVAEMPMMTISARRRMKYLVVIAVHGRRTSAPYAVILRYSEGSHVRFAEHTDQPTDVTIPVLAFSTTLHVYGNARE